MVRNSGELRTFFLGDVVDWGNESYRLIIHIQTGAILLKSLNHKSNKKARRFLTGQAFQSIQSTLFLQFR